MKQLLSILFLFLSLAIQYSKQLNYLQCRIANAVKSVAPKCDCENQGKEVKVNSATVPPAKAMVHFYLDDYYIIADRDAVTTAFCLLMSQDNRLNMIIPEGVTSDLYHPPRC